MRNVGVLIGGMVLAGMCSVALASAVESSEKAVVSNKLADVDKKNDVIAMAEVFGIIVGAVTEDIRKELNLRSAEGVAVLDIIGDTLAEKAGIKVGAVIAEINKKPVRNLDDFGRLLPECMNEGNCTVGTWEPTNPDNQGQGGQMNFHFVPKRVD